MLEKIKAMLAETFCLDENDITVDTNLKEDLDADSLDLVELVMALEDEYDMTIPEDDLLAIQTVGDFINVMKANGVEE
ncbi:MAG: acyl carrier protein [Lachnospiraceae bacterium]|nr:acyl carrier protein [Candidatus Equihabitans merdae]